MDTDTGSPRGERRVPKVARYADKEFIVGPGLDELLSPEKSIVLLDEDFGDVYGDYIFLGYDVFSETINVERADIVGIYSSYVLLSKNKVVTVCGKDPRPCTLALAAHIALGRNLEPREALEAAWSILTEIYDRDSIAIPLQAFAALQALTRLVNILGKEVFSTIFSLASNYEYGYGRISYGETITWANNLGASDNALIAAALSFLALSLHGAPHEILRYRLEAVGESSLISLIGPRAEKVIATLRNLATTHPDKDAALLQMVVHLGPGTESTIYVDRDSDKVLVYCKGKEPSKECVTKIQNADKIRKEALSSMFSSIRLVLDRPEPVVIKPAKS